MSINSLPNNPTIMADVASALITIGGFSNLKIIGYQAGQCPVFTTTGAPTTFVSVPVTVIPGATLYIMFGVVYYTDAALNPINYTIGMGLEVTPQSFTSNNSLTASRVPYSCIFKQITSVNQPANQDIRIGVGCEGGNWMTDAQNSYYVMVFQDQTGLA